MRLTACACLLALLGIAGCAQVGTNTASPVSAGARAAPSNAGTILSMRPVTPRTDSAAWRAALLAAAGGAAQVGDDVGRLPTADGRHRPCAHLPALVRRVLDRAATAGARMAAPAASLQYHLFGARGAKYLRTAVDRVRLR